MSTKRDASKAAGTAVENNAEALLADNERLRRENQQLRGLAAGISEANKQAAELMVELELAKDLLETRVEERTGELKKALNEHARLSSALEQAVEMIIIADTARCIDYVNPAFERVTGYSRNEAMGQDCAQLLCHNAGDADHGDVQEAFEKGEVWTGRVVNKKKDGTSFSAEASISPLRNDNGAVTSFVVVLRDVTQEVKLETQLQAAAKMEAVGQLAAGIAHEINTPIQYVGDNTRFLKESFTDILAVMEVYGRLFEAAEDAAPLTELLPKIRTTLEEADIDFLREEIPQAIEQALEGVARVAKIVQAMREFSHPGMDEKNPVDINRTIENTLSVSRNAWKYAADVETHFDPNLPHVTCLPGDINQALLNLIVNAAHTIEDAVKAREEEKGRITITTRRVDETVEVRIQDTGMGIPAEVRQNIFDPFFTTKDFGRGTGQGLAIAHNAIVNKHDGSLTFETKVGEGTTFIIRLPITPACPEEDEASDREDS
jgi:PAS domain S-box-containing protein